MNTDKRTEANHQLMAQNDISVSENDDGGISVAIRHDKGTNSAVIDSSSSRVTGVICSELRAIDASGEKLTRQQKANRVFNALMYAF